MSEVWIAEPPKGFVFLEYAPGHDPYPVAQSFDFDMPGGFDPGSPAHDPIANGFPSVAPLLQGYDVNFGTSKGKRFEHPIRQIRIDAQSDGWNTQQGGGGITRQGPRIKVIAGIRDNSGEPPDDPFIIWIHVSALVVYS